VNSPLKRLAAADALAGKSIVVTGASRGLGRSMAVAVAAAGARVAVTGRDTAALLETVAAIGEVGGDVTTVELDVTDAAATEALADRLWAEWGQVDAVFANAGISLVKPAVDTTAEEFSTVLDTNVLGTFHTVRSFGGRMLEQGFGKVVTVSSDIGIRGAEGWIAYGASKAAVISMTKTLAWEWAPTLTVNSIAPGAFATDINSHLLVVPEVMAGIQAATPMGRVGRAEEIGDLATFLASAGSDFVTGQVFSIDGGIQRS
jgi:NAD(P)-dependent dehydrogenase (short-subunit alcohol dehydrogenase family)